MGRSRVTRNRAKEYILANPTFTNKAISATLGINAQTVSAARHELMAAGLVQPAWGDHKSEAYKLKTGKLTSENPIKPEIVTPEGSPFDTQTTKDLNDVVDRYSDDDDDGEEIDIGKLKRILWRIARHEPDNRIRTSAIWTLTRIQQDIDERPLGPGLPKSKQEIIDRLLLLFDGVGAALIIETMQIFLDRRKPKESSDEGKVPTIESQT